MTAKIQKGNKVRKNILQNTPKAESKEVFSSQNHFVNPHKVIVLPIDGILRKSVPTDKLRIPMKISGQEVNMTFSGLY